MDTLNAYIWYNVLLEAYFAKGMSKEEHQTFITEAGSAPLILGPLASIVHNQGKPLERDSIEAVFQDHPPPPHPAISASAFTVGEHAFMFVETYGILPRPESSTLAWHATQRLYADSRLLRDVPQDELEALARTAGHPIAILADSHLLDQCMSIRHYYDTMIRLKFPEPERLAILSYPQMELAVKLDVYAVKG